MFIYHAKSKHFPIVDIIIQGQFIWLQYREQDNAIKAFAEHFPDDYEYKEPHRFSTVLVEMIFKKEVTADTIATFVERLSDWTPNALLSIGEREFFKRDFAQYQKELRQADHVVQNYFRMAERFLLELYETPDKVRLAAFKDTDSYKKFAKLVLQMHQLYTNKWLPSIISFCEPTQFLNELAWKLMAPQYLKIIRALRTQPEFIQEFNALLDPIRAQHYVPPFSEFLQKMESDLVKLTVLSPTPFKIGLRWLAALVTAAVPLFKNFSPLSFIPYFALLGEYFVIRRRDKKQYNALLELGDNPQLPPARNEVYQAGINSQASFCPQLATFTNKSVREDPTAFYAGQATARLNRLRHRA
jgi:hypothetical protein